VSDLVCSPLDGVEIDAILEHFPLRLHLAHFANFFVQIFVVVVVLFFVCDAAVGDGY
jgi:hypothetical protein